MVTVPCIILDADNRRAAELALIENLQRENLNIFEQAGAIAALIDIHAMTQEEIAKTLAVSQSCVANKLRLLRLTIEERDTILACHLSERHARAFLKIKDLELRRRTVQFVADHGYNVAQTEEHIDSLLNEIPTAPKTQQTSAPSTDMALERKNRKCVIKDLRLFYNTIERAVTVVREAGFFADSKRTEQEDGIVLTVMIRYPLSTTVQPNETIIPPSETVSRETDISTQITNIR
jgi:ParB family chromosome partitioning protein